MRIAVVQSDVVYGAPGENAARLGEHLDSLAQSNVDLALFPEAYLTGYCATSRSEASTIAIQLPSRGGESGVWKQVIEAVEQTGVGVVVGYAGLSEGAVVNAATMWLPGNEPMTYFKSHLPLLGMDRFAQPGTDLPVFNTPWGKVGLLICYDLRIPEPSRVLALRGAQLIILPTNWPGTSQAADYFTVVRASENKVFLAACDRVGEENGFTFIGRSGVFGPDGACLAKAGDSEEVLIVDLDLAQALDKQNVYIPGEYELDLWGCRQPELYRSICDLPS